MDHKRDEPNLSYRNGISQVLLYGEFTTKASRKVRYALSLTDRDLTVQKITSAPAGRSKVVFNLRDCVGSRAVKADDNTDAGAYFTAYFYPFKKRWMSSGVARQRTEQCFRVASSLDPHVNLEEAQRWARAISEGSALQRPQRNGVLYSEVCRPCKVLLLLNPHSGKGQALSLFNGHVQRMLHEAGIPHTLVVTERQNHARELVREAELSKWDALVIMSGDGLLFEVVNGLMEREDWEEAIQTPLAILPGGSGNALAASIQYYAGWQPVSSEELLVSCGFVLCKGLVSRLDLTSVLLGSGPQQQRLFSFLSLAWGFVADVDIESEKYRHVGAARFTVGTLVRLASLRVYQGKLAYLPAAETGGHGRGHHPPPRRSMVASSSSSGFPSSPTTAITTTTTTSESLAELSGSVSTSTQLSDASSSSSNSSSLAAPPCPASTSLSPSPSPDQNVTNTFHNYCNSNNAFKSTKGRSGGEVGTHPTTTTMSSSLSSSASPHGGPTDSLLVPLDQPVPAHWTVVPEEDFVLVLAMYQSHLAEDLLAAPESAMEDGLIHLFYVKAGISRATLLRLFLAMEKGAHVATDCPHLVYERVRALRLEPHSAKGTITVDGELVEYGPVQAQVHGGLARLVAS
ncbi:sphingosine kinase 1 [Engraulis encrasicolus]|uniref:sphingosine kinase 1 n=1 Tax=Engraulis encrasicolus TaxID=184585 RepID=UPI002FD24FE1